MPSCRSVRLFDRKIAGDLARLRLVSKFSTTCYCGHTLQLLVRLVVQLVVRFHRVIAREVIGSRMTSRRSLRLIVWPIADRHDWLHDQSQIAMTGCTTNRRSPRLVAQPIADCPDSLGWHGLCWGLHGLCGMSSSGGAGWISACTFTCPSAATSASRCDLFALPLPFLGGISSALLGHEVERILILTLSFVLFLINVLRC